MKTINKDDKVSLYSAQTGKQVQGGGIVTRRTPYTITVRNDRGINTRYNYQRLTDDFRACSSDVNYLVKELNMNAETVYNYLADNGYIHNDYLVIDGMNYGYIEPMFNNPTALQNLIRDIEKGRI